MNSPGRGTRRSGETESGCLAIADISGYGKNASLEEILDWRPFDYYTILNHVPMPLMRPMRMTYELEDVPGGTRVTEYVAPTEGFGQRFLVGMLGRMMSGVLARGQESLRAALAAAATAPAPDEGGGEA